MYQYQYYTSVDVASDIIQVFIHSCGPVSPVAL